MPTGEKEGILLHFNERLQEEETGNFLTPSSWEKRGPVLRNRKSQETDTGIPGQGDSPAPAPGESCGETEPPGMHRGKGPRTIKGGGSVLAGRAARTRRLRWAWARRLAGLGLQRFCRPGLTHQLMVPKLALPPGSSAATGSSGITSGFSQSPGSDVTPPPIPGRGGDGRGPGR